MGYSPAGRDSFRYLSFFLQERAPVPLVSEYLQESHVLKRNSCVLLLLWGMLKQYISELALRFGKKSLLEPAALI